MNAIQWHGSAVRGSAVRGDVGTFFFARRSRPLARVLALLGVLALVASTQIVPRPPAEAAVAVADVDGAEAAEDEAEPETVEADLATPGDVPAPEQVTLAIADEWDVPAMAAAVVAPISHPGPEPHGPEGPGDEVLGVVTEPAVPTAEEVAELHLSMVTSASVVTADSVFGATFTITNHGPGDAEDVRITYAFGDDLLVVRSVHCDNDPFGTDGCDLGTIKVGETVQAAVLLWSRAGALGAQPLGVSVSTGGTPATVRTPGSGDGVLSAGSDDAPGSEGDELDVPAGRDTVVILTPAPTVGVTAFPAGGPVAQDEPAELSVVAVADTDTVPANSTVTYTVFVTNSGPGRSIDTTVTIGALPGLTLTATDGCLEDPSGLPVCSIGSLAASSTKIVTFTFVAGPNPQGAVDFTVQVDSTATDPISLNDESTVQLEFNGPPVANDDTAVIAEDAPATALDVAGNDADPDGDPLTITAIDTSATTGTVTLAAGVVSYDPAGAFDSLAVGATATDTFGYTVEDGIAGSSTGTVVVTISGVNEAPVVVDDAITTTEDATVTVTKADLLADDTDANSDTLTFGTVSTTGTTGDVTTTATQVTYDPDGEFEALGVGESDTDTFTYGISDGNGGTDNGTVTVTVNGVNDAPDAVDDTIAVGEDDVAAALTLLSNDSDPDTNDTLSITAINVAGTFGEATLTNGVVSYDPDGDFEFLAAGDGSDTTFTYTVSDSNGGTDTATVTLEVTGANDAPTAVNDVAMAEAGGAAIDIDVDANDTDPDAFDVPTLKSVSAPGIDGSVAIVAGKIRYTPPAAPTTDTFSYAIEDGQGATATGTVTVTVAFGPLPPTAVDDTASIDADAASMTLNVLGNDTDPNVDTLRVASINSTATIGSVSLSPAGVVSFDPNGAFDSLPAGQTTTTTFTYVVTDDDASTTNDSGTVTITVSGVNDTPTAVGDTYTFGEDDAVATLNVTSNDTDPDVGDTVTVTAVTAPTRGTATLTSGVVSYDPAGDFEFLGAGIAAHAEFDYTITDANGATDTATVFVTIEGANDAPIAPDAAVTFSEDGPGATVSVTPTDPENDAVTIASTGGTPTGSVTLVGGLITYDPNGAFESLAVGETSTDSFTYDVSDGKGGFDTGTITVTINGVNDPIVANDDLTYQVDENVTAAIELDVLANDTDVDTLDSKTISSVSGNEGTVAIVNGKLTYLPDYAAAQALTAGATVTDVFTYLVSDGSAADMATVRVTINGQNDPPTTGADLLTIDEDDTANVNVISNDSGGEATDTVTLDSVTAPTTGVATKLTTTDIEYTASGWDQLDDGETANENVTYTAIDGLGATSTGTLTVTVNGVNDAPVATGEAMSAVTAGPAIPIMVLDNDFDPDASDTLEITGVAALPLPATPTQGMVAFTATSVTYTPHLTFIGTDAFSYTISDGDLTATAIVSVTVTPEADLSITVADDADPIVAGGDVTYTVTVTNNGPSPATSVSGGFLTPTDTTLIGSSSTALGTIGNGMSADFTVSLRTDESPNSSTVTFMPSVSSGVTDPNTTNNAGSEDTSITPTPNADLNVTASVDTALVVPGDTATWTVTVENLGPQDATAVAATSTLPAGVTLVNTTGCSEDPAGVATCSLGTIAAGTSASFDIAASVNAGTTGTLQLSSSASSPVVDFTPGNDRATSSTVSPVPPTAVDDAPPAASTPGMVFHTPVNTTLMTIDGSAQDLDTNDTVGDPVSTITSFGGGSLGGAVTDHLAGSTATINGVGSITVNGDGTLTFVPVSAITGVTSFNYRRTNVGGTSDAAVTIAIGAQPNAVADSYASIGNVGISVPAANGLLSNDAGDSLSISTFDAASVQGGLVAVAADGGFTYNPAPGTTGADTFTYTIANGFGTSTATVTINLSGMIWFVDETAAAGGDGTFDGPFNVMPASVGGNGDTIFVKTNASGAIALKPQQKLIGAGASTTLAAESGVTVPAFSFALPVTGGARPTVTGTAAAATVGLSSDNTVRGLALAATGAGGAAIGETTPGNVPGTVTILEASASATGGSAIQVSGGTQNITLDAVTAAGSSDGVQLTGSAGGVIELSGISINVASAAAVKVDGLATITVTGTNAAAVTNPVTAAVEIAAPIGPNGVTFEIIDSNGGPTAIKLTGTGSGAFNVTGVGNADASGGMIQNTTDDAISLNNVGGPVTLKNMTFTNIGNPGIAGISGHDVVHVQGLTGKLTIDNADVSIVSDNFVHGVAGSVFSGGLEVTNSTIDRTNRFDSMSTSGDGTNQSEGAIWADGISGPVTITGNAFTNGNQFVYLKPSTSVAMTAAIDSNSFEIPDNGSLSTTGFYCINIDGAGGTHTVKIGEGGANTFTNCFLRSIRMHASAGTIGGSITNNTMTVTDHDDGVYDPPGGSTNWSQGGVWLYTTGGGALAPLSVTGNAFGATGDRWLSNLANLEIQPDGSALSMITVMSNTFTAAFDSVWQVRGSGQANVTIQNNTYLTETLIGRLFNEFGVTWEGPGRPYCVAARSGANLTVTINNEALQGHELDAAQFLYGGASLQLVEQLGGSLTANVSGVQITPTTAGNNDDISVYAGVGGTQTATGATAIVQEPAGAFTNCGVIAQ